jgi:hypothetical protein
MLTLLSFLITSPAMAQDCDAKQLAKEIDEASPIAVPRVYLKLAECDADVAKANAAKALGRTLHGDEGNQASLAALKVGSLGEVMDWVDGLEPDQRSQTMLWMGDQCGEVDQVGSFFTTAANDKRDKFLAERWYVGMAKCRVESVQALLREVVENDAWELKREQLFAFVSVYARNLGAEAVDHLKSLPVGLSDPKEVKLVLNAFADAANVGSREGMDEKAAKAAIAAIGQLGPQIPPDTIDQARDTLLALGDEPLADEFVKYRWPEKLQGGTYHYGVVATETSACKNGKTSVYLHSGQLTDSGRWPDALEMIVEDTVKGSWGLTHGAKCKGTSQFKVVMTEEPVDDAAFEAFVATHAEAYADVAKGAWKSGVVAEDTGSF